MMQEQAPITIEAVDIGQILKTLPHRYPMLLIDRGGRLRRQAFGHVPDLRLGAEIMALVDERPSFSAPDEDAAPSGVCTPGGCV